MSRARSGAGRRGSSISFWSRGSTASAASALAIAHYLAGHARVERVYYPGLASHPQHELARRQMRDFGGVVAFELDGGFEQGNRFADALRYFSVTASVGSTESLVMPPQLLGGQQYTAA